jgi:hypothetical protein
MADRIDFKLPPKYGSEPDEHSSIYTLMDEIAVTNQPNPTYLIDQLFPENSVCLLGGMKGNYKSFFAIDAALTMTHGLGQFHGHKARKGAAIYIAGEGAGGLGKRVKAWRKYHKVDTQTTSSPFWLIREPVRLLEADDISKIVRTIKQTERAYGCDFLTLWFDTVSRGLQGALENEESWGRVITNAERIKEEVGHGMSFIGIAHHGKEGASRGVRGSSVAEANADNVISVFSQKKPEADNYAPDEVEVTVTKLKDDEDGTVYRYVTCPVEWTDQKTGLRVDSIVLVKAEDELPQQKEARLARRAEKIADAKPNMPPKTKPDKKAQLVTKITELPAGRYTMKALCEAMGGNRNGEKYDEIRNLLPENDVKTVVGAGFVTKTICRSILPSEIIEIAVQIKPN